jgi:TetR/AcrR family transcriptional regulator, transcriptional repressor for nem operon
MARPRQFDESQVLDRIIRNFWRGGYEATSLRDIAAETGLTAPSLYNAFGDKHALFRTALERYVDGYVRERIRRLDGLPPTERIGAFVRDVIERSIADPESKGCLLINAAVEVAPRDAELGLLIRGYLQEIEDFFLRALDERANRDRPGVPPRDAARSLMALVFGLRVMARANPQRELLEGAARPLLTLLGVADGTTPLITQDPRDSNIARSGQ